MRLAPQLRRVLAEAPLVEVGGPFHRFVQLQYVLARLRAGGSPGLLDTIGSLSSPIGLCPRRRSSWSTIRGSCLRSGCPAPPGSATAERIRMTTYIRDLIDLPERVYRGDFVLRLAEGVTRPEETLRDYVVTPQLATCFDQALAFIRLLRRPSRDARGVWVPERARSIPTSAGTCGPVGSDGSSEAFFFAAGPGETASKSPVDFLLLASRKRDDEPLTGLCSDA